MVVVGAGMAGLTAARLLTTASEPPQVVVLDKGRGVGGRMATRRVGRAVLDHGAQFVTTHTEEFAAEVGRWQRHGVVAPWFTGQVGPAGVPTERQDGHVRYRGAPSMTAIAKHLAAGLDVHLAVRVAAVRADGRRWRVETSNGALPADSVVLTAPVPQTLDLLAGGGVGLSEQTTQALAAVRYDPCIAVLAVLAGPAGLPEPGAVDPARGPVDWLADNQAKGISPVPAVTLHADAAFSHDAWTTEDAEIAERLLDAAGLRTRVAQHATQVHRWRYARPSVLHPERCQVVPHPHGAGGPLVFAGDAFAGSKVEGAYRSGVAAAEALLGH